MLCVPLKSFQSCPKSGNGLQSWTVACQVPLSVGFSRQEYWSGLLCPSPGDLIKDLICVSLHLLYWQSGSLPLVLPGKPKLMF